MTLNQTFSDQVRLLVTVLPQVYKENCFALKGGTAINLFIRDMPRLSVDIDLAYLPLADRETSLKNIDTALKRIGKKHRQVPTWNQDKVYTSTKNSTLYSDSYPWEQFNNKNRSNPSSTWHD